MMSHAHASMTTVQASRFSKKLISSLLRSFRRGAISPEWFTAWIWKKNFAVSRPIMLMLITGDFHSANPSVAIAI
jgi:hypothetical protein